jgi:titin
LRRPLPEIFDPVVIDGYTQGAGTPDPSDDAIPNSDPNGFNGKLLIEIDGSQLDPGYSGLVIYSGVSTVRGLAIGGFQGVLDASEEFVFGGSALDIEEVGANTIEGNFFGTDVTGTVANPNAFGLVAYNTIAGGANRIGGTSPAARNVVSGNAYSGIVLQENDFIGNSVQGNFIGTDSTGRRALGNGESGVFVYFDSNNEIGGAEAGAANVISGNLQGGVDIGGANASDNLTQENFIGTDLSQTLNLGNSLGGVNVYDDAAGNPILGNVISFNGALGIDLGYDGLTPNDEPPGTDPPDQDSGPNRLQNFPVLTSVGAKGVTTNIQGSLASTPNTQFRIEFFANNICDASGSGEGLRFLGFDVVTTDPQGVANIATVLSEPVFASEFLTSTATVIEGPSDFGDTSEFSECLPIEVDTGPTPTPVPTGPPECPDFDFDESGFIGPEDLLTLFAGLQTTDLQFDISGDGVVDDEDLLLLNACWHLTVSQ